jgi:hypothetical protein
MGLSWSCTTVVTDTISQMIAYFKQKSICEIEKLYIDFICYFEYTYGVYRGFWSGCNEFDSFENTES